MQNLAKLFCYGDTSAPLVDKEHPKATTHRYELYCASKAAKTTQCTVHCDLSVQDCESWNRSREEEGRWEDEVLAALAMRCI